MHVSVCQAQLLLQFLLFPLEILLLEHDELGQIPVDSKQSPNFPLTTAGMAQFPEPDAQGGNEGGVVAYAELLNIVIIKIIVTVSAP